MVCRVVNRKWYYVLLSVSFVVCAGLFSEASLAASKNSKAWPSQVNALYQITFNGFDIGSFKFEARVIGNQYVLDGDAEITALLGVINWRGLTRAVGQVSKKGPTPKSYAFNFRSHSKGGLIKIGFEKANVHNVSMLPPLPKRADEVPLQRGHLSNVLDPLTTVMAMARPKGNNPCAQSLPVFDGKQRLDLVLSYRRTERMKAVDRSRSKQGVVVCGVKYRPIGGYRPTAATMSMAQSDGIEIAFHPIPSHSLFVPKKITIPTIAGTAVLQAMRIHVDGSGTKDRVALAN